MAGKHSVYSSTLKPWPVLSQNTSTNVSVFLTDSARRSGRATKGQHTRNLEAEEVPTPPKRGGKANKSKKSEPTPPPEEEEDAIIRCICGYIEEDEDDDRKMICCEKCEAWQHNECMEVSENDEELPDKYYCEQCKPKDHKELLAKIARGEKPWEERAKKRERKEQEKKSRKGKGKKGRKSRASELPKTDPAPEPGPGPETEPEPEVEPMPEPVQEPEPQSKPDSKLELQERGHENGAIDIEATATHVEGPSEILQPPFQSESAKRKLSEENSQETKSPSQAVGQQPEPLYAKVLMQ